MLPNKLKLDYDLCSYVEKAKKGSSYFHTFIDRQSLSVGVLVLDPGEEDTQEPHDADEVYFVISGDGFLKIRDKDFPLVKDRVFFVRKGIKHHFHGNTKELVVLYFFGGPDS